MQRRAEFQLRVRDLFLDYARNRNDLEYFPPPPPVPVYGDTQANTFLQPLDRVLAQWHDYHEHGIMPRAGGRDDQPLEWDHDMRLADRLYARLAWEIRKEVKDRQNARRNDPPTP